MTKTKIVNRHYEKAQNDSEVDCVFKYTYNDEKDEYNECGCWPVITFLAHKTTYDDNTEDNYDKIVSELKLE